MSPPSTDNSSDRPPSPTPVSRRAFLVGTGTVSIVGLAGCTTVADWIGDRILSDVNLFNDTDEPVHGAIEIVAPSGDVALSETFELDADDDGDGGDDEEADAGAVYDDVWDEAGEYEVGVELEDGFDVQGDSQAEDTVTIDDPDEEMLAVIFEAEELPDGISFAVGEALSEFAENAGL